MNKVKSLIAPSNKYEGIRPINIYLMRFLYVLMAFVLGFDVWGYILNHSQPWEENEAVAWSVWAAFSVLALLGLFRTVQMIPILLLEIFYKVLWLVLVAVPLWKNDTMQGSGLEETTFAFLLVILPVVAVPWGYVFNRCILGKPAVT